MPGNCLLYFPSYRYLEDCLQQMLEQGWPAGRQRWVQGRHAAGGAELLPLLQQARDVAAFCVLGGAFGEGIDLPGDELHSVVIVGVGLPQVSAGNEQLRQLFGSRYGNGFAYAYQYPAAQKGQSGAGPCGAHRKRPRQGIAGRCALCRSCLARIAAPLVGIHELPCHGRWTIAWLGKGELHCADNPLAEAALAVAEVKLPHADELVVKALSAHCVQLRDEALGARRPGCVRSPV